MEFLNLVLEAIMYPPCLVILGLVVTGFVVKPYLQDKLENYFD